MPSPLPNSIEIALTGMRFHARVGILPHERELPQPLEIDIRCFRDPASAGVLDYRELHALATGVVAGEPLDYLETIAADILAGALALSGVTRARVVVRKPHVALGGPLDHAEVAIEGANA